MTRVYSGRQGLVLLHITPHCDKPCMYTTGILVGAIEWRVQASFSTLHASL